MRTAVTVKASRNADKKAAEITNNNDSKTFDLIDCKSLVKITISRFFRKRLSETIKPRVRLLKVCLFHEAHDKHQSRLAIMLEKQLNHLAGEGSIELKIQV